MLLLITNINHHFNILMQEVLNYKNSLQKIEIELLI